MELRLAKGEGGRVRREREIVRWVARLGAVSVGQIGSRFGVGRSVAYGLVRRLVCGGSDWNGRRRFAGDPTLISTSDGRDRLRRPRAVHADDPDRRGRPLACLWQRRDQARAPPPPGGRAHRPRAPLPSAASPAGRTAREARRDPQRLLARSLSGPGRGREREDDRLRGRADAEVAATAGDDHPSLEARPTR